MSRHGLFTKEQLAKPFGLPLSSIDLYVTRNLLHPIHLHDGIFYTSSDLLRLEIILKAKRLGYRLDEVKLLIENAKIENAAKR